MAATIGIPNAMAIQADQIENWFGSSIAGTVRSAVSRAIWAGGATQAADSDARARAGLLAYEAVCLNIAEDDLPAWLAEQMTQDIPSGLQDSMENLLAAVRDPREYVRTFLAENHNAILYLRAVAREAQAQYRQIKTHPWRLLNLSATLTGKLYALVDGKSLRVAGQ